MTRLILVCGVLLLSPDSISAQTLRIFQIDVESADAALIVMPNGKTLLIDSGKNGMGRRIKKVMDDAMVSKIDVFVNSHYHEDHFGGIKSLVDLGVSVLESFDRGEKTRCFTAEQMAKGIFGDYMRTVGEDARPLRAGDTIAIDPVVTITVVASSGGVIGASTPVTTCDENDLSVSLLLTFAGFKALYGGDKHKPTEAKIAARDLVMDVDLFKAHHHGSHTSSLLAFMTDLRPSVVVISNGSHMTFKHPRQVTLNTYHSLMHAPAVFQTNKCLHPAPCGNEPDASIADPESSDEDGTILITVDAATSAYTVAYGTTTRPFPIKSPVAPVVSSEGVVISSLLPNPAGDDAQREAVTVQNKGTAALSLVGWTLRDRSGATWNLSGSLAPGTARTFKRLGQAMTLNNAGDEITLVDATTVERDRFEYTVSSEGVAINTSH
jgi:beta-lactamase superfamily II metal-dependent hydrolase